MSNNKKITSIKEIFSYNDLNLSELDSLAKRKVHDKELNRIFKYPDIMIACIFGDYNKAKYLLSKYNCVNERNDYGYTALSEFLFFYNLTNRNIKILELLLDNGANLQIKYSDNRSILHVFNDRYFLNKKSEMYKIFEILLNYGTDINSQDDKGNTILMDAISYFQEGIVKFLLTKKIDVKIKNNKNETALDIDNRIIYGRTKSYEFMLHNYKYNDSDFKNFEYFDANILI